MDGSVVVEVLQDLGLIFLCLFLVLAPFLNLLNKRSKEKEQLGNGPDIQGMDERGIPYEVQCEQCRAAGSIQDHGAHGKPKNGIH